MAVRRSAVLKELREIFAAAVAKQACFGWKIAADHIGDFIDRAALEFHDALAICSSSGRFLLHPSLPDLPK
jgi:hypothetical protein